MNGEGFAYFAWHRLTWPYPCECAFIENHVCYRSWVRGAAMKSDSVSSEPRNCIHDGHPCNASDRCDECPENGEASQK